MSRDELSADLLVIGGGMAGMTTGYAAAQAGARVVLVEKAPAIGGSAAISGAHLWTATSFEQLRAECPAGDPELGRAFLDGFPAAVEVVRSSGVEFSEELSVLFGRGWRFDMLTYLRRARAAVEGAGGYVQVASTVERLLLDGDRVVGAAVRDTEGTAEIRAPWTVLATGGFQANRALLQRFFGDRSAQLLLRSNPYSSGDGLQLGLAAGATHTQPMDPFYGHLLASPLPEFTERQFVRHALLYSEHAMLINTDGRRFAEEWLGDHWNAQRVGEQPEGRALIIIDERIRTSYAVAPIVRGLEAIDTVQDSAAVGARVASAPTLRALGQQVSNWGYRGDALEIEAGAHATAAPRGLESGPYHAIEVRAGITFTQGGLRVDGSGQVLRADGAAVAGLLAAGADLGGLFNGGYAGGLALASVFGVKAALRASSQPRAASR